MFRLQNFVYSYVIMFSLTEFEHFNVSVKVILFPAWRITFLPTELLRLFLRNYVSAYRIMLLSLRNYVVTKNHGLDNGFANRMRK